MPVQMPPPLDTAPPLTTVPGVELARTGSWAISSGSWTPTREDFHAAVAAMNCPAVRPPVIKLGHVDPRFDGQPAVGSVENLRVEHGGHSLVGDLGGIPTWLANRNDAGHSVLSSAFPSRSVEGVYGYRCQLGHQHPFVLTGLALLGVTPPGVGTLRSLRDIADLYGVAAEVEPSDGATVVSAVFKAAAEVHTGAMVALVPTVEHAARLAVDGGEPVEQLHLTLAYLGDAIDIDEATRRATITALATAMAGAGAVDADGFAISVFNPGSDERDTCIVLGVSGSEVDDAQSLTIRTLAQVPGLTVPEQHTPFAAHVTLTYSDDLSLVAALADRCGPIVFDRLRVAFGGTAHDIPLGPTIVHARYNPGQRRAPRGGEHGGEWVSTGGAQDSLRLAGRINLADGEHLIGSGRVNSDQGGIRLAATDVDGRRTFRFGAGGEQYGQRDPDTGTPAWDGNPAREALPEAERQRLDDEYDALDDEYDTAGPARQKEITARQEEIREQLSAGDEDFNGTAILDERSIRSLVDQIRPALTEADKQYKAEQATWDEIERLEREGGFDPERMAELRRLARADDTDYVTFASGVVAGSEWGDVHFSVEMDDTGPSVRIGVQPKGTPDDWGDGRDWQGIFEAADMRKFFRLVGKLTTAEVTAKFDPHQRRDSNGQWTDAGIDTPTFEAPADAPGMTWEQVHDLYGDTYDEGNAGEFTAAVFEGGDFTFFYRNEHGRFEPVRELTADDARDLADHLDWAASQEELQDGGYEPTSDLIDYMPVDDEQTAIVGYSGDGDVRMAFSNTGDHVSDLHELGNPDVDAFMISPDVAADLADMLRDMADRHDELDVPELVSAAADRNTLKRWWTEDPEGMARWVPKKHPWTALYRALRSHIKDMSDASVRRITTSFYMAVFGHGPNRKKVAATTGGPPMPATATAEQIRAKWNSTAEHNKWITEIAPDGSYVVVVNEPARTFTRHQVHVSAKGQITFGRGRPIRLGYVDASGAVTAQRTVFASRAESRPVAAADPPPETPPTDEPPTTEPNTPTTPPDSGGVPVSPAAEPEPTEPKEDPVSPLSDDMRSRLGLAEGADEAAALAAIDALKQQATTPAVDHQSVAAAAERAEKAENAQELMKEELARLSGELATIKASTAATVKASFFDALQAAGKLKPADRTVWEKRYDRDPEMVADILGARAQNSEVPIAASGHTGGAEDSISVDDEYAALVASIDPPTYSKEG